MAPHGSRTPRRTVLLGATAAGLLLLIAAPSPSAAVASLREPPAADPTAPLVAVLSLLAWLLTGWLLVTVALTAGAHLPGAFGRGCRTAAGRVAPAGVRRAVEVALGLSIVVGVVGATPASASPGAAGPAPAAASLDWPAPPAAVDLDWAATPAAAPEPAEPTAPVVVQPGDSLWAIAERDLAARTGTEPSDADVAQAWPSWWAANRDTVGDDPDVISPGTELDPPAAGSPS